MAYKNIADRRKHDKKYYQEHREEILARVKEYTNRSEVKQQITEQKRKYYQKERERLLERSKKYNNEHKKEHNKTTKKWCKNHPERTRESLKKHWHKRERNLGFIPLNEFFVGSEAHHIDFECVVYIPKELHRSIWHNIHTGQGITEINDKAFEWLTEHVRS